LRMMKFLFAASKEKLKTNRGALMVDGVGELLFNVGSGVDQKARLSLV
jgi:hypothetical protein